jgi:hypothetical protein
LLFGPPVGPLVWDGQLAEPVSVCVSPCPKIRAPQSGQQS